MLVIPGIASCIFIDDFLSGNAAKKLGDDMSEFVSLKQISEELGIPMKTVYLYRNQGLFPCYKFGKHYRVAAGDFEEFKNSALLAALTIIEMGS